MSTNPRVRSADGGIVRIGDVIFRSVEDMSHPPAGVKMVNTCECGKQFDEGTGVVCKGFPMEMCSQKCADIFDNS